MIQRWAGRRVLVLSAEGPRLEAETLLDAVATAIGSNATVLAVPVERLDPGFFDLRTGVAGAVLQKLADYRLHLAVVGTLPDAALGSAAFQAFMRETDRRDQTWFAATLPALRDRLARGDRPVGPAAG